MASMRATQSIRPQMRLKGQLAPHQLLATKLTAMAKLDLARHLASELIENPLLEEIGAEEPESESSSQMAVEDSEDRSNAEDGLADADLAAFFGDYLDGGYVRRQPRETGEALPLENLAGTGETLTEHLLMQLRIRTSDPLLLEIGAAVIGNINDVGRLDATVAEVAGIGGWAVQDVERALAVVQSFEPAGVAARDLRECLLLQAQRFELGGTVEVLARDHLDLARRHRVEDIAAGMGIGMPEVAQALDTISVLDPFPGAGFASKAPDYVSPDVAIVAAPEGGFVVEVRDEGMPRLRLSQAYQCLLRSADASPETKAYVRERVAKAQWLLKAVDMRERTIVKVTSCIAKLQQEFLDHGVDHLRPLILRDVANHVGMHESTVHRAVCDKFVETPRGVYPLKYFFHSGVNSVDGEKVSSLAVKELMRKLIAGEDTARPLSDEALVRALEQVGLQISRRGVANYREDLRIPCATERRHRNLRERSA